jgi:hypothetical protein
MCLVPQQFCLGEFQVGFRFLQFRLTRGVVEQSQHIPLLDFRTVVYGLAGPARIRAEFLDAADDLSSHIHHLNRLDGARCADRDQQVASLGFQSAETGFLLPGAAPLPGDDGRSDNGHH